MTIENLVRVAISLHSRPNPSGSTMNLLLRKLRAMDAIELSEFCLQMQDAYAVSDRRTPVLMLAFVLEHALKNQVKGDTL